MAGNNDGLHRGIAQFANYQQGRGAFMAPADDEITLMVEVIRTILNPREFVMLINIMPVSIFFPALLVNIIFQRSGSELSIYFSF